MSKKDWHLLEAYKETGLTPEQIIKLKDGYYENRTKLSDSADRPGLQNQRCRESCSS